MDEKSSTDGNVLIIANPGTGKTTALANRVVELLSSGAKESDILCITFTNKAASEMRARIDEKIREAGINARPDLIEVHTFHSYAYDYLSRLGLDYELAGNNVLRYSIYKSFIDDNAFNYSHGYILDDLVPKTENAIRYVKSFGILPKDININKAEKEVELAYATNPLSNVTLEEVKEFLKYFVNAYARYEKEKEGSRGYIDYNDMLIKFVQKYDGKKRYRYVLVDELQDLNELEAEIAVLSGDNLFLVGDKKQAIFGFQGGSLSSFKRFENDKNFRKESKVLNYRSLQPILDYSKKHFLSNTADPSYEKELQGLKSNRKEGKAEVKVFTASKQINAAVKLFSEMDIGLGERTAIITRTNGQLIQISRLLDKKKIEYSTTAGSSTSDSARTNIVAYLSGLLYDDRDIVISALFTPFAGITLKEAFKVSKKWPMYSKNERNEVPKEVLQIAKHFFDRKKELTIDKIGRLFNEVILPISMQIGKDYYLTAQALNSGASEFFELVPDRSVEAFFDYLSILEENYEPAKEEKSLLLTTVHKAKGREFDNVIYVPISGREKESFVDMAVYSIIKATVGTDVREELAEEQARVDFVAFTRAKNRLYVVANQKNGDSYKIGSFEVSQIDSEEEDEPKTTKYDEAYALFVNGRMEEAKKAINGGGNWLLPMIKDYFSSDMDLSYSTVESVSDPYEFLKEKILNISELHTVPINKGLRVHKIAKMLYEGTLDESTLAEEEKRYLENIKYINSELMAKTKSVQTGAEVKISAALKDIYNEYDGNARFKAFLDAVYESGAGSNKKYIILDYKTDRDESKAPDHRRQLAVYKKLLAASSGISEKDISIAIGFIGLRGNINTGKLGHMLDLSQEKGIQIKTFEKHLERFLSYKKDPRAFAEALLKTKSDEPLFGNIAKQLKEELG
ncbi:MAG: ATP-dependent helicase [Methanothrix sp.]